jgi:serine/threonine-protein kinase ATR
VGSSRTVGLVQHYVLLTRTDENRNADDDELNFVLLSLVAYLGHSNPVVSGVAFNEVGHEVNFEI